MTSDGVTPFHINLPDSALEDLKGRLRRVRLVGPETAPDSSQGVRRDGGGVVATRMGARRPPGLRAIHVDFSEFLAAPPVGDAPTPEEKAALEQGGRFLGVHSGYHVVQRTRPQTIGYALTDSPAGQAAWIYERFLDRARPDALAGAAGAVRRGDRQVRADGGRMKTVVITDEAKAGSGAWFIRADPRLSNENSRLTDRLSAELDPIDVLLLGARFQRCRRTETADGLETDFAPSYPDSGTPGHPVAVSEGGAMPLDPRASSSTDARRLYDHTRGVLAR
nr:hypothetical protein [Streptomyces sabulosicollis]